MEAWPTAGIYRPRRGYKNSSYPLFAYPSLHHLHIFLTPIPLYNLPPQNEIEILSLFDHFSEITEYQSKTTKIKYYTYSRKWAYFHSFLPLEFEITILPLDFMNDIVAPYSSFSSIIITAVVSDSFVGIRVPSTVAVMTRSPLPIYLPTFLKC